MVFASKRSLTTDWLSRPQGRHVYRGHIDKSDRNLHKSQISENGRGEARQKIMTDIPNCIKQEKKQSNPYRSEDLRAGMFFHARIRHLYEKHIENSYVYQSNINKSERCARVYWDHISISDMMIQSKGIPQNYLDEPGDVWIGKIGLCAFQR